VTLKKPSDLFNRTNTLITEDFSVLSLEVGKSDTSVGLTETFDRFKNNLEKIDELSEQVQTLSEEISSKLTKKDLENAMISHLMVVNENFNIIKNQVKGLNKSDLNEFKTGIAHLSNIVDNLVTGEIPKYKRKITGIEVNLTDVIEKYQDKINEKINEYYDTISEFTTIIELVQNKINDYDIKFDEQRKELISILNKKIGEHFSISTKISSESKIHKKELDKQYESFSINIEEKITDIKANVVINESHLKKIEEQFDDIKTDVVINESHLKKVENFILKNHNHIVELKKEVFNEISKLSLEDINDNIERIQNKINYIEEVYNKINFENIVEQTLPESLASEPAKTNNSDPLTPLDQNFVTQKDLQDHYRLFVNRVQQQLASLGGGGETQLKYLDDVVGIATNASQYDGKFLKYDHSIRKFVFDDSSSITVSDTIPTDPVQGDLWYDSTLGRTFIYYVDQDGSQWVDASPSGGVLSPSDSWISTTVGIHTLSNVGIGTTNPTSKLTVVGGDIRVGIDTSEGVILTSPNNTKYRLIVDDFGVLSTVLVP